MSRTSNGIGLLLMLLLSVQLDGQETSSTVVKIANLGEFREKTAAISAGDIDGDGDVDLVVANGRHWPEQNRVFINDGSGQFPTNRILFDQLDRTYAVPLADLDGDGDLDAVVGNDRQPSYVLLNDGKGSFTRPQDIGSSTPTRSISLADIDGQQGPDILVTNRGTANQIFFNDGQGRFVKSIDFGDAMDSTIDVAVADLDGDGHPDLALANRDGQPNRVYFGDGTGKFPRQTTYGTGSDETRGVTIGDVDGDGNLDLLNANIGEPNAIYFGDGTGQFKRTIKFGGNEYSFHLELLASQTPPPLIIVANAGSQNSIFRRNPDGSMVESKFGNRPGLLGSAQSVTYGVACADLDGDGQAEVVTANSDGMNGVYKLTPADETNEGSADENDR